LVTAWFDIITAAIWSTVARLALVSRSCRPPHLVDDEAVPVEAGGATRDHVPVEAAVGVIDAVFVLGAQRALVVGVGDPVRVVVRLGAAIVDPRTRPCLLSAGHWSCRRTGRRRRSHACSPGSRRW